MRWRGVLLAAAFLAVGGTTGAQPPTAPLYFDWYHDNYVIASYDENGRSGIWDEIKFQISVRTKIAKWRDNSLVLGYTQKSFWDVAGRSSPFESTDFSPELYVQIATNMPAVPFVRLGFLHESNGLADDLETRSWDRVYVASRLAMGTQTGTTYTRHDARPGVGLSLEASAWAFNAMRDEEDDFERFAGYFELQGDVSFESSGEVLGIWKELFRRGGFRARLRGLPLEEGDRGFLELGARVSLTKTVQLYAQYFRGYGEQLTTIDSDGWESEAIKAGLRFGT